MPNDSHSDLLASLSAYIAHAVVAGAMSVIGGARATAVAAPGKRSAGRPPKANHTPCVVPGCGKKTVAKGLCQSHYRKAGHLKMNMTKLSSGDLKTLAADGRATRWAKKK
jgi:hypothetical protein